MKRQSPMSAIEPMIRREREMYHELKHQNAELLEVLKYIAEAKNILLDPYNGLYFRDLVNKAKQAIDKVEGKE